jgi:hypothetical protein
MIACSKDLATVYLATEPYLTSPTSVQPDTARPLFSFTALLFRWMTPRWDDVSRC